MKTKVRRHNIDGVSTVALALAIIDAACELRDFDWEADDPGPLLAAIDHAVDRYRQRFREVANGPPRAIRTGPERS